MANTPSEFKLIQTRRTFEEVVAQVRAMLLDGSLKLPNVNSRESLVSA